MNYLDIMEAEVKKTEEHIGNGELVFVQLFDGAIPYNAMLVSLMRDMQGKLIKDTPYDNDLRGAPIVFGYSCEGRIGKTYCYIPNHAKETSDKQTVDLDNNPIIALDQLVDVLRENAEHSLTDGECVEAEMFARKIVDLLNDNKSIDNIIFAAGALTAFKAFTNVLIQALNEKETS